MFGTPPNAIQMSHFLGITPFWSKTRELECVWTAQRTRDIVHGRFLSKQQSQSPCTIIAKIQPFSVTLVC